MTRGIDGILREGWGGEDKGELRRARSVYNDEILVHFPLHCPPSHPLITSENMVLTADGEYEAGKAQQVVYNVSKCREWMATY